MVEKLMTILGTCKFCHEIMGDVWSFYTNSTSEEIAHVKCYEDDKYGV